MRSFLFVMSLAMIAGGFYFFGYYRGWNAHSAMVRDVFDEHPPKVGQ